MNDFSHLGFFKRIAANYARSKWEENITPQSLNNKWYGSSLISKYLNKRMRLDGKELEIWKEYYDEVLALPEGSEKTLFYLFNFPRVIGKESVEV